MKADWEARAAFRALRARSAWLGTVESCTGGQIADRITNIPGASETFFGSWVVYDNRAKRLLGVPQRLLRQKGAVSREIAEELAKRGLAALRQALGTSISGRRAYCVATTGIAGPTGGTAAKPVGLCWIALAGPGGRVVSKCLRPVAAARKLDRLAYKKHFSDQALRLILRECDSSTRS